MTIFRISKKYFKTAREKYLDYSTNALVKVVIRANTIVEYQIFVTLSFLTIY